MIEALKKRYKTGDVITIHTSEASFTGKIDSFEDTCIVIETDESIEFIANNAILRFSAPKIENKPLANLPSEPIQTPPIIEKLIDTETVLQKSEPIKIQDKPMVVNPKPPIEYKVGDKIPLDELAKRTENKTKFIKSKDKPTVKLGSLADLSQLILPEIEAENNKIVPANGIIISNKHANRGFGFVVDKFGYEAWFTLNSVLDDDLLKTLKFGYVNTSIPVLFTPSKNNKGDIALYIQKPKTIEQLTKLAKKQYDSRNFEIALGLTNQILTSFKDNYGAIKLKEEIESQLANKRNIGGQKNHDSNYHKAVKAKNVDKNFEEALKYYFLAFDTKNERQRETCIKDIGMLYVSMGEREKALDFVKKYEKELPEDITNYNYLANFFSSVKDFEKVIEYIDLLLEDSYSIKDKRKHSQYLSQKGFALIQINEIKGAKMVLEKAVSLQSANTYASRLLEALDNPDTEVLNQAIAEAEFESFGGGLSKFISDTLADYNDYHGVPPKVIDTRHFSHETLGAIKRLIDTAGRARPRERANYLMTEAKLSQELDPQKDIKSILARYCNAMALNHMTEDPSMDVIRGYYLEAFSLEEQYPFTAPQVALYLISYKSSFTELLNTKTPSIEEALKKVLDGEVKENIWEGILSMFMRNRSICAQISNRLYNSTAYRKKSLDFLNNIGLKISNFYNIDSYINLWNLAIEKRQRDYSKWLASIKSIYTNQNIETISNQLFDSLNEAKKSWLTQLDTFRLNTISNDILDVLNQYLRQSSYRDKERYFGFGKQQINQLISEIREKPTKFSYEGFIPLLEKIDVLLDKSFKTIEAASTPKITVSILGEASIVGNDNVVPVKVLIENSRDSSPIRDVKIVIQDSSDITFIRKNNEYFDSVDGGENCELQISVKVSDKVIKDKATSANVVCIYKKRNQDEPVEVIGQLSLRLYSEEEFELIPNPYEKLANGGPVTDKSMFYGRNEFIERITEAIISTDSKQVVIFGQKRSGKSSVLYHLKQSLEDTERTFCVSFSIGDIFETLSSATFFYKILSVIEEELENLTFEGITVPEFKCPPFSEFKEAPNPSDLFRKHIRIFKRACSVNNLWKDKKLVIMIDEFTYLYTAIKIGNEEGNKVSDAIMKQWKAITQNEDASFSSVLVGQDVFPTFKDEFPNEFGVTQDERLTYLSKEDAIRLIKEPIGNTKSNRERFIGNAIETIIDYTSCNPYYIQIFCARLVTEMNRKKYIEVTNADIKEVANSFINGGQALTDDKFDNLLNPGEKHDIQKIPQAHSKAILKQVASNAMNVGFCLREQISIGKPEYEDEILKDLVKREVLEQKGDSYKIQVKLFQEWLLKH